MRIKIISGVILKIIFSNINKLKIHQCNYPITGVIGLIFLVIIFILFSLIMYLVYGVFKVRFIFKIYFKYV